MLQQLRNPFRVLLVGLATRHILDVLRIRQDYRELSFQNVPDWLPVNAAGFHRYLPHTELPYPFGKLLQFLGHRAKATLGFLHASRFTQQNASRNRALMYIQTATSRMQHVHDYTSIDV